MALTDENGGGGMFTMPVTPAYGGGNGGFGNFGGDGWWIILLFLLLGGWNNNNGGGGFGGGMGGLYPWMNQSNQINDGFRDQMLNDNITGIRDGIYANQLANLERSFAEQTANTAGLNAIQAQLAQCCCDNRAATADLKYTVATEACADRNAISTALRDVLTATQAQTQSILDKMCQDKIDEKNDTIAQLRSELLYARGQASQDVQTATIRAGQVAEVDALYERLNNCPVGTVPVYGRQPIFTCPNNGCGCGCGG